MPVQPIVNNNLSHGWYLVSAPIITANCGAADGDEQGTMPKAYWNVVNPDGAGDWSLRAQFQFLFPR